HAEHIGALSFHLERQEPARRADLQHALAGETYVPEIGVDASAQIPEAFRRAESRQIHHVIEMARVDVRYLARARKGFRQGSSSLRIVHFSHVRLFLASARILPENQPIANECRPNLRSG